MTLADVSEKIREVAHGFDNFVYRVSFNIVFHATHPQVKFSRRMRVGSKIIATGKYIKVKLSIDGVFCQELQLKPKNEQTNTFQPTPHSFP